MKSTTLNELNKRWFEQRKATHIRTYNAAGRPDKERWAQIVAAHKKRVLRRRGLINRAARVASKLNDINFWGQAIRGNRQNIGLPAQIHIFGNSGSPRLPEDF